MKLYYSSTSPFARMVRIALIEKNIAVELRLLDPWQDAPDLIAANPTARVPTLVTDGGDALTECQLILRWLDMHYPSPLLLAADQVNFLSLSGVAIGAIEAAAAIIIGRKATDAGFDETRVGLRRRRSIIQALLILEKSADTLGAEMPNLANVAAVVLFDYLRFRFAEKAWLPDTPSLARLSFLLRKRAAFQETMPVEMS